MSILKHTIAAVRCFFGMILRLPRAVALRIRLARRLSTQDRAEAERIDRIRHPDNYRGK